MRAALTVMGWLALATLVVGGAAMGLHRERTTPITEVRLTGGVLLPDAATAPLLRTLPGQHPDSLATHRALASLRRHPYVLNVSHGLESAGVLSIHVTERTPVLWLTLGSRRGARRVLLTADGMIIPAPAASRTGAAASTTTLLGATGTRASSTTRATPASAATPTSAATSAASTSDDLGLPTLSGLPLRSDLDPSAAVPFGDALTAPDAPLAAAVDELLASLASDEFARLSLRELTWEARDGLVARTPNASTRIVLGREGFAARFDKWHQFYRDVILIKGMDPFRSIDLRFDGNVITKETSHES